MHGKSAYRGQEKVLTEGPETVLTLAMEEVLALPMENLLDIHKPEPGVRQATLETARKTRAPTQSC